MNEHKERPILFSGPMVRAILDGRKTQTRRVIKHKESRWECSDDGLTGKVWPFWPCYVFGEPEPVEMPCPYGKPGDRLWVREAWAVVPHVTDNGPKHRAKGDGTGVTWRADWNANPSGFKWKPSIHMPRWASRITLEITGVRVERLQEISEADAIAEGIESRRVSWLPNGCEYRYHGWLHKHHQWSSSPINSYRSLWEEIHGPESWAANPWVWVVEFQKVEVAR
jgi:hypothetical protein